MSERNIVATFVINSHGRLQEWIAEEKGYFEAAGLTDYRLEAHGLLTPNTPKLATDTAVADNQFGAYQTYEQGREASVSCACHWTVNMAASAQHGRLWGECYTVSPCAIVVAHDSEIKHPEDLAGVEIQVGYQSGSHYATIQALEPYMDSSEINLNFGGNPSNRVDQLLDGVVPAATLFGPQLYLVEQLGYRKIVDNTFMMTSMVPEGVEMERVQCYFEALRMAQADIDLAHQDHVHHYLKELPERHAALVDVQRFGPGERLVFEPYSEAIYQATRDWVEARGIFDPDTAKVGYTEAVARLT